MWESVFDVKRGGNYGWSLFEGPGPLRTDVAQGPTPIQKPLTAYSHSLGQSITGGFVYRGSEFPELDGAYLYGDYVSGLMWGLRHRGAEVTWNPVIAVTGITIITFGHSAAGEQ
jgi:glucose/arabinose dehydrogenase